LFFFLRSSSTNRRLVANLIKVGSIPLRDGGEEGQAGRALSSTHTARTFFVIVRPVAGDGADRSRRRRPCHRVLCASAKTSRRSSTGATVRGLE
jgi:hypothetical protein